MVGGGRAGVTKSCACSRSLPKETRPGRLDGL